MREIKMTNRLIQLCRTQSHVGLHPTGVHIGFPKHARATAKTRGNRNRRLITLHKTETRELQYHFTKGYRTRAA